MNRAVYEASKSDMDLKVGAVLVKDSQIISRAHRFSGLNRTIHPEEEVLSSNEDLSQAILYITLEPCTYRNTEGVKSCCELILEKGVKKVVIGLEEMNEKIRGKGIDFLRKNGVEVEIFNTDMEDRLYSLLGERFLDKHRRVAKII